MRILVWFTMLMMAGQCAFGTVEQFTESFDGTGEWESTGLVLKGFDNQDWNVFGNGQVELSQGSLHVINEPSERPREPRSGIERNIQGSGSSLAHLEVKVLDLGEDYKIKEKATISLTHFLDSNQLHIPQIVVSLNESDSTPTGQWGLGVTILAVPELEVRGLGAYVKQGSNIGIDLLIRDLGNESLINVRYDNDIHDNDPGYVLKPLKHVDTGEAQATQVMFNTGEGGHANGLIDYWSLKAVSELLGDFDLDNDLDVTDIDMLSSEILKGRHPLEFDLTSDGHVDARDRDAWVHDIRMTYYGDANLDGSFRSSDLVRVFETGEYEDTVPQNSTWSAGDWNGDAEFSTSDLVLAFQDGGYEKGPRGAAAAPVPEPRAAAMLVVGLCGWLRLRRVG